jgi:Tfp pilus assembly protein PilF
MKMNKSNKVKMNKFKILSVAFLATVTLSHAQDIDQAKREIDGEKFQNAKTTLKSIIKSDPDEGLAYFLLGNVYLAQKVVDSAMFSYQNGLSAKDDAHFNYIGLGQMDLNSNDATAAKTKFEVAVNEMGRRDFGELIYVARAYMNADKPDYKAAISTLKRVNEKYNQEPLVLLALGDAYYGDKNQNEAYSAYRNAFRIDESLIRAKMQLGVLLKGAKAYTEAVNAFNDVIATNPNYGPLYRELAETYYYWAVNVPSRNDEYMKQALSYYEKYMGLTDYSLASRMRHADFLIVAHDYKALEIEANKMKEIDNVNPRILRYLGYSAYFNGNVDVAIKALEDYTSNATNNVMSLDYLYLGLSNIKKATMAEGLIVAEPVLFNKGIALVKKAFEMENAVANDLSEAGKDLYEKKMYKEAASIFEIATAYKESRNYLLDNFYLGNSLYFDNTKSGAVRDTIALNKADVAFGNVIEASPATQDVYVYRARTNSLLGNDELMIKYYQQYIDIVTKKGPEELAKPAVKAKLIEAYNTMAAGYANTDKVKAIEMFNKTLAIDPENGYAKQSVKTLK